MIWLKYEKRCYRIQDILFPVYTKQYPHAQKGSVKIGCINISWATDEQKWFHISLNMLCQPIDIVLLVAWIAR